MRLLLVAAFAVALHVLCLALLVSGKHQHHYHATERIPLDPNEERRLTYLFVIDNCTKEVGITFEDYAMSFLNNETSGAVYDKVKCVNACMFKAHGIMRQNGTIDAEKAVEHLLSSKLGIDVYVLRDIIAECSQAKEEDDCDTAQKLMDCVIVK